MKYSDICGKQVINIRDGSLIGVVDDLAFDPRDYLISSIYAQPCIPFVKRVLPWFFPHEQIQINVNEIENITGDVILVRFR